MSNSQMMKSFWLLIVLLIAAIAEGTIRNLTGLTCAPAPLDLGFLEKVVVESLPVIPYYLAGTITPFLTK